MVYISTLAMLLVLAASVGLGFVGENWFLVFGLVIVVLSAATSMILAFLSGRKAADAEKVEYESFLPEVD